MKSEQNNQSKVIIIWSSADRDVALNMVFMYALNAKKRSWWDEVGLIVWGPSAKLLAEDKDIQNTISQMKEAGVQLEACKTCADRYGVSSELESLGIEVKLMGVPLTQYLKEGVKVITF